MARDFGDASELSEVTSDYLVRIVDNPNSEYPVDKLIPGTDMGSASAISVLDAGGYYTGTNVEAVLAELGGVAGALAPGVQLSPGLRWAFFGDSITNGSSASNSVYSYPVQALAMVGSLVGRIDSIEAGTGGNTSAALLARVDATFTSYTDVRGSVIMIGANDAAQFVPVATFAANLTAIIAICRKRGPVVLCTVPPQGSSRTAEAAYVDAYNLWIKTFGPGLGCEIADVWSALVDTTSGFLAVAYDSGDEVHPEDDGHREMAQVVGAAMIRASGRTAPYGLVTSDTGATFMVTPDPLSAGGGTQPTGWYEHPGGTGTAPSYSLVTDTSGVLPAGKWAEMDFDGTVSGGLRRLATATNTNIAVGDRVLLCAHIQIEVVAGDWEAAVTAETAGVSVMLLSEAGSIFAGSVSSFRCAGLPSATAGIYDIGPVVWPVTVPAASSYLLLWCQVFVPTGMHIKARFGCVGVLNLTNLGIADQFAWSAAMVNT